MTWKEIYSHKASDTVKCKREKEDHKMITGMLAAAEASGAVKTTPQQHALSLLPYSQRERVSHLTITSLKIYSYPVTLFLAYSAYYSNHWIISSLRS